MVNVLYTQAKRVSPVGNSQTKGLLYLCLVKYGISGTMDGTGKFIAMARLDFALISRESRVESQEVFLVERREVFLVESGG